LFTRRAWFPAAAAVTLAAAGGCQQGASGRRRRVLIDSVHAANFLDGGLQPGDYDYHRMQGLRRAFDFLLSQQVECEEMTSGRLTPQRLAGAGMLFLNLVSAERPPFLVSEIEAIRRYIEEGGSLFVITDHSNCYYHTHRLQPLLTTLGIRSFYDTVCDEAPHSLSDGNGWIAVTDFDTHPVTQGLSCIAQQSGGRIDNRYAVARTSKKAWADKWKPGDYLEGVSPGLFGDFKYNEGEIRGQLGIVLARQLGRGRIVIVSDQNMLGDVFINYADNYRLWLNSCAYLLHDKSLAAADSYHQLHGPHIFCHEEYSRAAWGNNGTLGHHNAWAACSRRQWAFAGDVARSATHTPAPRLLVFAHNRYRLKPPQIAAVKQHLSGGGNVLILTGDPDFANQRSGVTGAVREAMGLNELHVTRTAHTQLAATGSSGGLHVVAGKGVFQNFTMPLPTEEPTADQAQRIKTLHAVIATAMPQTVAGP